MLRICTLAVLALCASGTLPAAEGGDAAQTPPATTAPATPAASKTVSTTMAKKANVRFGPSLLAKVVATLDAGAAIEVLGPAQGMPDWYAIRFPREGSAWIHEKNIKAEEGGKTFTVTEDRARVRDDARQGGNIVAELAKGEVVEAKEKAKVGNWVPIYPSSAVAYVHKGVINVPVAMAAKIEAKVAVEDKADYAWQEAQARYTAYKAALDNAKNDKDLEMVATLDWTYLDNQLSDITAEHSSVRVRLAAERLKNSIAPVVKAANAVQAKNGIKPLRDVPGQPPIVVAKPKPVKPTDTADVKPTPVDPAKPEPVKPAPGDQPQAVPGAAEEIKKVAIQTPAPAANEGAVVAQGFLIEQAVAALGTSFVIVDKDGIVCAMVKPKAGSDIQLSEFFYRLVAVKGATEEIAPEKHGLGARKIPLVMVDDVMLLSR